MIVFYEKGLERKWGRTGRKLGIRWNTEYRIGDGVFCLPLACGKQILSEKRTKNYGKKGKLLKVLRGAFRVETSEGEIFTALPWDCVPSQFEN